MQLRRDGDYVVATVTARSALLPGVSIAAEAVAALEPGSDERGSATLVAVAMMAVLLVITVGVRYLGSAVIARHRAQAAADLAALAAAAACPRRRRGMRTGRPQWPSRWGRRRADCAVDGLDVVVAVDATAAGSARGTGAGRAGPTASGGPWSDSPCASGPFG